MIIVKVQSGENYVIKEFPNSVKGNRESVKYIQSLYDERRNQDWYYRHSEIKKIEREIECIWNRSRKDRLETKLKILKNERKEFLEMMGLDTPPASIKIQIETK